MTAEDASTFTNNLCAEKCPMLKDAEYFNIIAWSVFETMARFARARGEYSVKYAPIPGTKSKEDSIGKWAYHITPLK